MMAGHGRCGRAERTAAAYAFASRTASGPAYIPMSIRIFVTRTNENTKHTAEYAPKQTPAHPTPCW